MAEIAGLVVGGISLTALFDQCINIIKYIDSGRQCSAEYQHAALMLTLIGGRLNRWECTIRDTFQLQATTEDGEEAELWLKRIRTLLEEAEKLGQRYNVDQTKQPAIIWPMVEKVQTKVLFRSDGVSLRKRARWALIDQEKLQSLVEKLDRLVSSLEKLFPPLHDRRVEMLDRDLAGLLQSGAADEPPQAVEALKAAAAKVDKDLEAAISSPSSHIYRNIDNTDEAMVQMGDSVSADFAKADVAAPRGGSHTFDGVRNSGKSVVQMGNMYGKSIFEMSSK